MAKISNQYGILLFNKIDPPSEAIVLVSNAVV